jgi:hypothetical protein
MHYDTMLEPPAWVDITTVREPESNRMCGVTSHLSDFMLMEPSEPVEVEEQVPVAFRLHPCAPNPVAGNATIRFDLPAAVPVRLAIYDVQGRRVGELARGDLRAAGRHAVLWDGHGSNGGRLRPGIYLVRLEAGGMTQTQRVVVLE